MGDAVAGFFTLSAAGRQSVFRYYCLLAERDGGVTAGPLLLPALPGILLASCCELAARSSPVLAAGPFLLPG